MPSGPPSRGVGSLGSKSRVGVRALGHPLQRAKSCVSLFELGSAPGTPLWGGGVCEPDVLNPGWGPRPSSQKALYESLPA